MSKTLVKDRTTCNSGCGTPIPPFNKRFDWPVGRKNMSLCIDCWRAYDNQKHKEKLIRDKKLAEKITTEELAAGAANNMRKLLDRTEGVPDLAPALDYLERVGGVATIRDINASYDDREKQLIQACKEILPERLAWLAGSLKSLPPIKEEKE